MHDVGRLFLEYARLDRKRTDQGLTIAEMEIWTQLKDQLNQRLAPKQPKSGPDRRQSVRVPTRLRCSFGSVEKLEAALVTDICRGGVFINTAFPLEMGTRLVLRICIDDSGAEVDVPGEVVSNNVGQAFQTDRLGMGIRFGALAPDVDKLLADLWERSIQHEFPVDAEPGGDL